MKKCEDFSESVFLYEFFCELAGIRFRLVSDDLFLKEIEFYKGGEFRESVPEEASVPIKLMLKYLHNYFSGGSAENFSILFRYNFKDTMVKKGSSSMGTIVLDMEGYTEKEVSVYRELVKIPSGERISYGELASKCGVSGGARFTGNTMAKNRFPVIVPCHRVVKGSGDIGNFSGGVEIKEKLLNLEKDYHKQ